ncbi:lysine-specific demethylase 4-like [Frankliniella occidentalis]|uniref:Lysine-specific demethylase 4-like n=1 Tax=Frankliniella occidentalis TaxID=133901 RepID=A0A9C6X957_FRAOC|nr:lysine-specific demethylase 4-like [Frankliniella occidentalis]
MTYLGIMDDSSDVADVLPSYFENGTAVFNVTDRDLCQFVKTIDKIESGGYVGGRGIFKLNVEESSRIEGTKSEELLQILKPLIKDKSCTPATGNYFKTFEKKMRRLSVYSAPKTCWSEIVDFKADVQEKPLFEYCTCEDCFTESDSDSDTQNSRVNSDSDKQKSQVKRKRSCPKKSDMLKYPSVLNLLPHKYNGLQTPDFYIGEEHSCFAGHTEDGALYAANYLHLGFPKIWITIPPEYCEKVRDSLQSLKMDLVHTSCMNSLNHKYYVFTLKFLDDLNVKYHITVQHVGQLIILEPHTIHWGFNCGPNIAEAVNFGTVSWIPEGVKAMRWRCRCYGDSIIHLDMRILVAAFYPEMMKSLFDSSGANTEVLNVSPEHKVHLPEKEVHRKEKIYECSACRSAYKDHKKRLIDHVMAQHSDSAATLLNEIEEKYPTKASGSSGTGNVCEVCSTVIRGSSTHLEKHYQRQCNNMRLDEKTREEYGQALERLQQSVKRRKKAVKAEDNLE